MATSKETRRADSPEPAWHEAISEFRSRAQRLFEAQRDRVDFLEASIGKQLAAFDKEDGRSRDASSAKLREASETSSGEIEELRTQLAQSRKMLNARAGELKQLRSLVADGAENAEGVDVEALLEQLSELRLERDEVVVRLADAERQIEQGNAADSEHFEELQRRFEVAVQEIRELKAKNSELQQQAPQGDRTSQTTAFVATSGFDWEQQKLRMMQELDADDSGNDPEAADERLSIESTIRITDQVIAEKDRHIADLKARLEEVESGANDAISHNQLLDSDDQIREERERLSRLEDEWREKLRQAEIDISVERAKLARERSELEGKLRKIEESAGDRSVAQSTSKQSGRWLSRLGLKEDDK